MIIISDTTALSNFIQIGELKLLQDLYGQIVIPQVVHAELMALNRFGINFPAIVQEGWK